MVNPFAGMNLGQSNVFGQAINWDNRVLSESKDEPAPEPPKPKTVPVKTVAV